MARDGQGLTLGTLQAAVQGGCRARASVGWRSLWAAGPSEVGGKAAVAEWLSCAPREGASLTRAAASTWGRAVRPEQVAAGMDRGTSQVNRSQRKSRHGEAGYGLGVG